MTGTAIGHYERSLSKRSSDRAALLAKLFGLKPHEISASDRGPAKKAADRPQSAVAKQRVRDAKAPSREEGTVLDALRAMPAAERRVVVKLVLAQRRTGSRTALGQHRQIDMRPVWLPMSQTMHPSSWMCSGQQTHARSTKLTGGHRPLKPPAA